MRLIDIDNFVFVTGRGNGKTIFTDMFRKIIESVPTVEAIPIDWIINHDQMPKEGKGHDAIMDMINTWKEERKGEKKTMTKTITFYELLTMLNDGTAPRKIYVQAEGKKHCYVLIGGNYTACNESDPLLKLIIKYRTSTRGLVDFKFIHYEAPILDEVEMKYLETVLRPFKNKISFIEKVETMNFGNKCYLRVLLGDDVMVFPYFEKDKMYTGMSGDKKYTPKDLGLWENAK